MKKFATANPRTQAGRLSVGGEEGGRRKAGELRIRKEESRRIAECGLRRDLESLKSA
jgi:hypothetical protein